MKTLILLVVLLSCKYCFSKSQHRWKRQELNLTDADLTTVQNIDAEARKHLMFLIVDHLNDTIFSQSTVIEKCEKKINETTQKCSDCKICDAEKSALNGVFHKVSTNINAPVLYAGEVTREIADWSVGAKAFFGAQLGSFSKTIGENFNALGDILANGGKSAYASTINTFKSIGGKLESLGQTIGDAISPNVVATLKDIKDVISKPFANIDVKVDKAGDTITDTASTAVKTIKNAVTSAWGKTFGRLFRKKRNIDACEEQCPSCTTLFMKNASIADLTDIVCGVGTSAQKESVIREISFLEELYNRTTQAQQITSIEFDPLTSFEDLNGNTLYTTSFFTWNDERFQLMAGILNISSPVMSGEEIAHQYFATQLAKRNMKI